VGNGLDLPRIRPYFIVRRCRRMRDHKRDRSVR
jgi:hypothetical protein